MSLIRRKTIVTVTLNPAVDKLVPLSNFTSSAGRVKQRGLLSAGGKGLNVSRTLKCLHRPTLALGIIGGRSGQTIRMLLKKEKLPSKLIRIKYDTRTNITLKDALTHNRMRVMGIGPMVDDLDLRKFETHYKKALRSALMVCLSGKNASGAPIEYYAHLIRLAKKERVRTILDTSGQELTEALKARPFIVKPNLKEAQDALQMKLTSLALMKKALKRFQRMGVGIILLTLGRRGALAALKDQIWYCIPPKVKINLELGCGDAFLGGFIHAYVQQLPFRECVRFATCCGSANCLGAVPGQINSNAVLSLLDAVRVKRL